MKWTEEKQKPKSPVNFVSQICIDDVDEAGGCTMRSGTSWTALVFHTLPTWHKVIRASAHVVMCFLKSTISLPPMLSLSLVWPETGKYLFPEMDATDMFTYMTAWLFMVLMIGVPWIL